MCKLYTHHHLLGIVGLPKVAQDPDGDWLIDSDRPRSVEGANGAEGEILVAAGVEVLGRRL